MTTQCNSSYSFARSLAVIPAAIMMGLFYLHDPIRISVGLVFAYAFSLLMCEVTDFKGHLKHTAIVMLLLCYLFAFVRVASHMIDFSPGLSGATGWAADIYQLTMSAFVVAVFSFVSMIPGWLAYAGLDALITNIINKRSWQV